MVSNQIFYKLFNSSIVLAFECFALLGLEHYIYNALNFSVDLGQRGSLKDGMIRERYVMFHIGISLHDIWFVKQKYD